MSTYVALLRAVNVGGANKLPMADLRALATTLGLEIRARCCRVAISSFARVGRHRAS